MAWGSDRPLPPALPPLTTHGLRKVLDSAPRACQEEPEHFTAQDGETPRAHAKRVGAARVICADCPVQLACLSYALQTRATSGVWAGLDADAGELGYLLTTALGVGTRVPRASTATAVARLRDRHPAMPAAEIAAHLGITARTVQRHLAEQADAPEVAA
jgi:WhiB family redox-sensing transcriptional regulator